MKCREMIIELNQKKIDFEKEINSLFQIQKIYRIEERTNCLIGVYDLKTGAPIYNIKNHCINVLNEYKKEIENLKKDIDSLENTIEFNPYLIEALLKDKKAILEHTEAKVEKIERLCIA